ncbi:MAG: DUF309 domain-containing protein [Granulosicoccus sp.]
MTHDQSPDYAYVPGQTDRHSDDAFNAIRETASPGLCAHELACCNAFLTGLRFIDTGFYWEAHEVLEPVWMALPDNSIEKQFVQGLIQLANGRLKLRMGRQKAALRLVGQARGLVPCGTSSTIMTLDVQEVHRWIDALEADIINTL